MRQITTLMIETHEAGVATGSAHSNWKRKKLLRLWDFIPEQS